MAGMAGMVEVASGIVAGLTAVFAVAAGLRWWRRRPFLGPRPALRDAGHRGTVVLTLNERKGTRLCPAGSGTSLRTR
jgi:hypothetical protein